MSYKLPQNAIPFDWEKYKSGKFEAITRGGYKPKQVYNLEGAKQPIVFVDNGNDVSFCFKDGKWSRQKECSIYDLFLIPKTRKVWEVVIRFATKKSAEMAASYYAGATVTEIEIPET